ncbi:MAG: ABC transporter ATP-binding protein [Anaerolineae bacterium]
MIALEAQSIVKTYPVGDGEVRAVDDVSFCIQEGELVALVGPSGSGKTTAVAMLAGLLRPTSGNIFVGGEELTAMEETKKARFRKRNIGFTFQQNNLVSYLTALENVELMLRLNGEFDAAGRARARELLTLLGLEERLHVLPRQLSGGQQQRVAIARSLINRPNLVLADEPTASLDTERAVQVVETLADLVHEQRRAGVMVTHDLRLVEYVDRIIQMVDGRLARIVSPDDDLSCLTDPASCEKITPEALGCSCEDSTP